jgi:hypothetical protein
MSTTEHATAPALRDRRRSRQRPESKRQYSRIRIIDAQRRLVTLNHFLGRALWLALVATPAAAVLVALVRDNQVAVVLATMVALIWATTLTLAAYRARISVIANGSPYTHGEDRPARIREATQRIDSTTDEATQ